MLWQEITCISLLALALLFASIQDFQTRTLPNTVHVALLALWALWSALCILTSTEARFFLVAASPKDLFTRIFFATLLVVFLQALNAAAEHIFHIEGIGPADIKLSGALSLFVGSSVVLVALALASLFLLLYFFARRLASKISPRNGFDATAPFVPFITLGFFCILLL